MKQTIEIEIEVPEGKNAVWKDGKVVFEDAECQLPKTWEEFCDQNRIKEGESFINDCCYIRESNPYKRHNSYDRNVLPNKKAAEQHLALMQLHQLRDCYRQGWNPNYTEGSPKACIEKCDNTPMIVISTRCSYFLSFPTRELAVKFLTNFEHLIKQAGDLI